MNTFLKKMIVLTIALINKVIPKNKRLIYIRSDFSYPDNSQAILEELLKVNKNNQYTIICEGGGFDIYDNGSIKLVKKNSIKALYYYFRSFYLFYDIALFSSNECSSKQISVNVWHGTAFKKIGNYLSENSFNNSCTYTIGYSPLFAKIASHAFGIPIERVIITGDPRIDYFYKPIHDSQLEKFGINKDNLLVIWMPTYRTRKINKEHEGHDYELGFPFLNSGNLSVINDFCKERNITLILKLHFLELSMLPERDYSNLVFLTTEKIASNQIAFYSLIARTNALITDYSSIFINYLVLDKPICFAYDDLEEYKNNRGMMFDDPESLMPGFKALNFEFVLQFLDELSKGLDSFKDNRKEIAKKLNTFSDNKNAERILKAVKILQ